MRLFRVFVFGTIMIAYGMYITTAVSDFWYDLGVKGQGQIYFKSTLWLLTQISFSFIYYHPAKPVGLE